MPLTIVNGGQFGDEGKGKIVDLMAASFDLGVRPTAGDNAGHTVVANGQTIKMRLTPSAIVAGIPVVIGDDVMINPLTLASEIENLLSVGIEVETLLTVSSNAHIVLPYHVYLDELTEEGTSPIGTTKRGIGPAFVDKVNRTGLRMEEFVNPELLRTRLTSLVQRANRMIVAFDGERVFDALDVLEKLEPAAKIIRPYVAQSAQRVHEAIRNGEQVLIEGAQGSLNDLVFGTYPYVTASRPIVGGLLAGIGVGPCHVDRVIGVIKPYQTRVGIGPVVGEIFGEEAENIVRRGHEYGTVTNRARRIMSCDLVALRHTCSLNGTTAFALTKLDVLDNVEKIRVVTGYRLNGEALTHFPSNLDYAKVEPEYQFLDGWNRDTSGIRDEKNFPPQVMNLIHTIENFCDVPVAIVSVGADRDATVIRYPELIFPTPRAVNH